ncbi:hypothetical protein Sru01_68800 [Sphaerisporangium rufum]|uniref:ATPase AAA-type core domain-containing protein n=1 Tax=Sphaerisporangium rufum TaxID=1381558 RepID=A0A919V576_9ACTN|nr:ATP-binding protein [Sphaerisporangium rufum]GII81898.1 hypothetical protein Sru01_68800 [Sphaerisporangium rufum]
MLLSFRVANHRSLRDEQHLLLTPSYPADQPAGSGWQAVPVLGIFGPNASGKSNVIDAIWYMRKLVRGSLKESEPGTGIERHPFALDATARTEPSSYVVDLLLEGVRHTYGFAVDDEHVVEEWMYSYPQGRKAKIFHRTPDGYTYGGRSPDSMRQVEEITESNVLYLSVAARSRQTLVRPVYDWFAGLLVRDVTMIRPSSRFLQQQVHDLDRLTALLRAADTGIESAEMVEETDLEFARRSARLGEVPGLLQRRKEIVFRHRGEGGATYVLGLGDQSLGTQAIYDIGRSVFVALDRGRPLVVDELDSSLHPYLSAQLIRLFTDQDTNPRGAQLIFTSHDATLLGRIQGDEVLQRDHIWFTEKNECGMTELFPLSDFKPRQEENRERRYLAGRYGAVPVVNDEIFAAAFHPAVMSKAR